MRINQKELSKIGDKDFRHNVEFIIKTMEEKVFADIWNNMIAKLPDQKNARAAFCEVGFKSGALIDRKQNKKKSRNIICDKDFQLSVENNFRSTESDKLNILQAPKIK